MTKEEIRVLILHKMKLHPDDVVWDIGAGTGSVSIECARQVPFGTVHSVERNETAVKLIYKNKEKFSADNLFIYEGDAAEQHVLYRNRIKYLSVEVERIISDIRDNCGIS